MIQIVKRYLTKNPKMNASKELMLLCRYMIKSRETDFVKDYEAWKVGL